MQNNYLSNLINFDIKFKQTYKRLIKNNIILIKFKLNNTCLKLLVKLKFIIRNFL